MQCDIVSIFYFKKFIVYAKVQGSSAPLLKSYYLNSLLEKVQHERVDMDSILVIMSIGLLKK